MEKVNFNEPIYIRKEAGKKKDAVRISCEEDIPEFLKNSIHIVNDELELDCVEGVEHAPLGSVIGYEESEKTKSGINTWHIANAATNLVEIDGVFYTKAAVCLAQRIGEEIPEFLAGAPIERNADGTFTITTDWGKSTGAPEDAYFVLYGVKKDGTPDANILTKSEKSYDAYFVCTKEGEIIGKLSELDPYSKEDEIKRSIERMKRLKSQILGEESEDSVSNGDSSKIIK